MSAGQYGGRLLETYANPKGEGRGESPGDEGTRTPDILLAKQALYQLSYVPVDGHRFLGRSPVASGSH